MLIIVTDVHSGRKNVDGMIHVFAFPLNCVPAWCIFSQGVVMLHLNLTKLHSHTKHSRHEMI